MPVSVSSVSMLEDVIVLDIDNLDPIWNTYRCHIDIKSPEIVFRLKAPVIKTKEDVEEEGLQGIVKVEDGDVTLIPEELGTKVKLEDSDLFPQTCEVSPCRMLTRRIGNPNRDLENPTAPWRYLVHPFPASNITSEVAKMDVIRQEHEDSARGLEKPLYKLTFPLV
ncbi:hypothetical protein DFH29DRAFT_1007235 [Suillus ampliporus]|nr:hypothetical protein DFH29DRAFT_1007235 [Suillus ampliporus]